MIKFYTPFDLPPFEPTPNGDEDLIHYQKDYHDVDRIVLQPKLDSKEQAVTDDDGNIVYEEVLVEGYYKNQPYLVETDRTSIREEMQAQYVPNLAKTLMKRYAAGDTEALNVKVASQYIDCSVFSQSPEENIIKARTYASVIQRASSAEQAVAAQTVAATTDTTTNE